MSRPMIDETGNEYGRLKVKRRATPEENAALKRYRSRLHPERNSSRRAPTEVTWFCECSCGNTTVVRGSRLRRLGTSPSGATQSCGCLRVETSRALMTRIQPLRWRNRRSIPENTP